MTSEGLFQPEPFNDSPSLLHVLQFRTILSIGVPGLWQEGTHWISTTIRGTKTACRLGTDGHEPLCYIYNTYLYIYQRRSSAIALPLKLRWGFILGKDDLKNLLLCTNNSGGVNALAARKGQALALEGL